MYSWRITKYNPAFRISNGSYNKPEWSSFSDIGKSFEGVELSLNEYLQIESKYINAIILFINNLKIPYLKILDLEKYTLSNEIINKYKKIYPYKIVNIFNKIKNNAKYNIEEIDVISKLVLREHIWLKLEYENKFFIHFGYDYYLYIGSIIKNNLLIDKIINDGLFVEEYNSPYM